MDIEGQSEVTNKLRSAIKKKLSEICDNVDDELPEYIMILVANQRSKSHIEKDLALFLSSDTVSFTNWLWDLLNTLNVGSKTSHLSKKSDPNISRRKDIEADEDAIVLDCDPDEQEKDFFGHEDTSDSNLSKVSAPHSTTDVLEEVTKDTFELKSQHAKILDRNKNKIEHSFLEKKDHKIHSDNSAKEPLSSKVVPVRKRLMDPDNEYDPCKLDYRHRSKTLTPRNYGGPAALQANKLLLKAVDDATKSILDGKDIQDFYKPTPIKVLSSHRFSTETPKQASEFLSMFPPTKDIQNVQPFRNEVGQNEFSTEKEVIQNPFPPAKDLVNKASLLGASANNSFSPRKKMFRSPFPSEEYAIPIAHFPRENTSSLTSKNPLCPVVTEPDFNSDVLETSSFSEHHFANNVYMTENYINSSVSPHNNRTICLRTIPLIPESPDCNYENLKHSPRRSPEYSPPAEEIRPKSPHFIVTLEGVKLSSFKRKLEDKSIDSMDEDEDEDEDDDNDNDNDNMLDEALDDYNPSPSKKLKINERCKYWPACKNSDNCSYHHPAVPCKCFPDCKFGDKCLYIHPNCKFDALCSRKDCPFTHASKRKLPMTALPVRMAPVKRPKMRSVCKFFPKCAAKSCSFMHPKLCHYGTACRIPMCLYSHFSLPPRSQMKWQSFS